MRSVDHYRSGDEDRLDPLNTVSSHTEADVAKVRREMGSIGMPRNPANQAREALGGFGPAPLGPASYAQAVREANQRARKRAESHRDQLDGLNQTPGPSGAEDHVNYLKAMAIGDHEAASEAARKMAASNGTPGYAPPRKPTQKNASRNGSANANGSPNGSKKTAAYGSFGGSPVGSLDGGTASGGLSASGGRGGFGGGNIMGGLPQFHDPMRSATRMGVPTWYPGMGREEVRWLLSWMRSMSKFYYRSHYLIATLLNLYAKYPFAGISLHYPDPEIEDAYNQQFFDILNYEEKLPLANLMYYALGEAPMLGTWSESAKMWVDEEILSPDHVDVVSWPGPHDHRESYFLLPPESLVEAVNQADEGDPVYRDLLERHADYIEDWRNGVPNELPPEDFSLIRHDMWPGEERGYPILSRVFDKLIQEERLNQSLINTAERYSSPFLMAKIGGDILPGPEGSKETFFPTAEDITHVQSMLEATMSSVHKVWAWHAGINFENPLAGVTIPNLNEDFDRLSRDIAAAFGVSLDLIYGGSSGTYAAGALAAETMMQNLQASQRVWTKWMIDDRARRVAEERGYYVVERKGKVLTKPMEEVPVYDEESDVWRVETRRKLALPGVRLETIDWRDEQNLFANMITLRDKGVFIPDSYITDQLDPDIDHAEMHETYMMEAEEKAEMEARLAQLQGEGVPPEGAGAAPGASPGGGAAASGGGRPPTPGQTPSGGDRPPQSDEQRADQPASQENATPDADSGGGRESSSSRYTSYRFSENSTKPEKEEDVVEEIGQLGDSEEAEREVIARADDEWGEGHYFDERIKRARRGPRRTEVEPDQSYADRTRGFTTFTSKGKKTGTLYYMQGKRIKNRPTR